MTAETFWKATRPDGRDFHTGTVDYGAALAGVSRDLITAEQYQTLAGPWETVIGPVFVLDAA